VLCQVGIYFSEFDILGFGVFDAVEDLVVESSAVEDPVVENPIVEGHVAEDFVVKDLD
jgi:hypothetical protein